MRIQRIQRQLRRRRLPPLLPPRPHAASHKDHPLQERRKKKRHQAGKSEEVGKKKAPPSVALTCHGHEPACFAVVAVAAALPQHPPISISVAPSRSLMLQFHIIYHQSSRDDCKLYVLPLSNLSTNGDLASRPTQSLPPLIEGVVWSGAMLGPSYNNIGYIGGESRP